MSEKYEQGDWVRYYREGKLVLGQVEYIQRAGLADLCDTLMTDNGSVSTDGILEVRKPPENRRGLTGEQKP